jgi:hypothetical protein
MGKASFRPQDPVLSRGNHREYPRHRGNNITSPASPWEIPTRRIHEGIDDFPIETVGPLFETAHFSGTHETEFVKIIDESTADRVFERAAGNPRLRDRGLRRRVAATLTAFAKKQGNHVKLRGGLSVLNTGFGLMPAARKRGSRGS